MGKPVALKYLQQAWTEVEGFGLSWPHKSGSSQLCCGWRSWHNSAASRTAWAEHKLKRAQDAKMRIGILMAQKYSQWRSRRETYSQRRWPRRCLSLPQPPRCSWWQTSWWPCPWARSGHSWCSGWAAHAHGPSWRDHYSSFSWSVKHIPRTDTHEIRLASNMENWTSDIETVTRHMPRQVY